MRILFVRHGETDLNNPRRMQGISNLELNENGINQANLVRDKLKNEKLDIIITSPLKRAKQTATIINEEHHLEILVDERIKEINCGDLEGKLYKEEYWDMDYNYSKINGENIPDFQKRIYKFIEYLQETYDANKTILIVAHGGVSRIFRCYFEKIPKDKNLADYGIKNCEIKEFIL